MRVFVYKIPKIPVLLQRGHLRLREVGAVATLQTPALDDEREGSLARPHQLQLRHRRLWEEWQVGKKGS